MHHCVAFVVVEKDKNVRKGQTNKVETDRKGKERIVKNISITNFYN